ncbi:SRPBCC domain-containing protein [Marinitoga sp. 38H-ov]|uniref:SRPBCC family protein n=1 Tax=Marinitoga sp. 38H-ov TaxID=1755814 RepID=UPI0013EDB780|nr:SRPBCC domain-containing protein [Marinitoga sp. 38H-ov]KAF2955339.1 ATPase [Marinitoga sp. 38H-ov]
MIETPPIEIIEFINAPIDRVWNVLVNEKGWDPWFTDGMKMKLKTNGKIYFRWERLTYGEIVEDNGYIIELLNKKFISFWWYEYEKGYRSKVDISFQNGDEGTWIKIVDYTTIYSINELNIKYGCAVGWGQMITLAKAYIEKGIILI